MHIVAIQGHPKSSAYNRALVDAYVEGAREEGATVEVIDLATLHFDPVLRDGYARIQSLEPDLVRAQRAIEDADHVVLGFPVWWGSVPALVKGFFDRTFLPGWAFRFKGAWPFPERLLSGRSAHVIMTMDAPRPVYALVYRNSAHRAVIQGVLGFCGIAPVTVSTVSGVKFLPDWVLEARINGLRARGRTFVRRRLRTARLAA